MKKSQLSQYPIGSAAYVIAHAKWQRSRGKHPSMSYLAERNPRMALVLAVTFMAETDRRQDLLNMAKGFDERLASSITARGTEPDDASIEVAIRTIVATSTSKEEICRRAEGLGCYNLEVAFDTPNDQSGFEALDLVRALGGLTTNSGSLVMIRATGPSGNFIDL